MSSFYTPDLPKRCGGYNSKFSICHSLDFKKGVLVMTHHNELRNGVAGLAGKSFTPSHMRNNPPIHQVYVVQEGKSQPTRSPSKNPPETT